LAAKQTVQLQANGPVVIPIDPQHVLPSIPGVMVHHHTHEDSTHSSSSNTQDSSSRSTSRHSPGPSRTLSPGRSHRNSPGRSPGHIYQPTPTPAVIPPGSRYAGMMPNAVGQTKGMPSPYLYQGQRSTTPEISPPPNAAFYSIPSPIHM